MFLIWALLSTAFVWLGLRAVAVRDFKTASSWAAGAWLMFLAFLWEALR